MWVKVHITGATQNCLKTDWCQ